MAEERPIPTELIAFDFDHTIVDMNSDIQIKKLAPNGQIPEHIERLYNDFCWTDYMAAIFEYLHEHNVTREEILTCLEEIPLIDGISELFSFLFENQIEIIIISDANSVFIEHLLRFYNLHSFVSCVYTNRAFFEQREAKGDGEEEGKSEAPKRREVLRIEKYHLQDWCSLSSINLCKGFILEEHMRKRKEERGVEFRRVYYSGDGTNDFCPSLRLKERDVCFARKGYSLEKQILKSAKGGEHKMQANVVFWKTAKDILRHLRRIRV